MYGHIRLRGVPQARVGSFHNDLMLVNDNFELAWPVSLSCFMRCGILTYVVST